MTEFSVVLSPRTFVHNVILNDMNTRQLTWDSNMQQEKEKIVHGKFFDFRAQKSI